MPDELDALRKASAGLLYPSDTDAPFDVCAWPDAKLVDDVVQTRAKDSVNVSKISLDDFFAELKDSDDAAKFTTLRDAIAVTLTNVQVLRVGHTNVEIFIVGKTKSGIFAGLHTTSVET